MKRLSDIIDRVMRSEAQPEAAPSLPELRALAAKATPGPWQVIADELPCYLGAPHITRRIFAAWDHPQLKGPLGVVNCSVGLPGIEGERAQHFVHIDADDADFIAAANPTAVLALCDRLERLEAALRRVAKFGVYEPAGPAAHIAREALK